MKLSTNYEIEELIEPKVIGTLSKHLRHEKEPLNGVDPYSHDMQEE